MFCTGPPQGAPLSIPGHRLHVFRARIHASSNMEVEVKWSELTASLPFGQNAWSSWISESFGAPHPTVPMRIYGKKPAYASFKAGHLASPSFAATTRTDRAHPIWDERSRSVETETKQPPRWGTLRQPHPIWKKYVSPRHVAGGRSVNTDWGEGWSNG